MNLKALNSGLQYSKRSKMSLEQKVVKGFAWALGVLKHAVYCLSTHV